jgi:imidazolonepropionase-like amidohydrolase
VSYIKLINSGIFNPATAQITDGGFDKGDVSDIVRYAGDKGLDVICHANGDKAIREAVSAGVSAIVHGLFVSDETLFMMWERKTSFIPTVNAFASLPMKTINTKTKAHIDRAVEGHLMAISKAAEIGTRVLPGSDSGPQFLPYGKSCLDELAFFKKAGICDRLVLTWAVAEPFKIGMPADFVILKGSEIKTVFFHGAPINK